MLWPINLLMQKQDPHTIRNSVSRAGLFGITRKNSKDKPP